MTSSQDDLGATETQLISQIPQKSVQSSVTYGKHTHFEVILPLLHILLMCKQKGTVF